MSPPSHVLIVGGGLAGPSLAIALARRNIKSTIFEIRPGPSDIGGAVMLAPNALRVLDKTVGVYEEVKVAGYSLETATIYSDDGMELGKVWNGDIKATGYPAIRIKRPALHSALLKVCEHNNDKITLKYNEILSRIEETQDGVVAHFESGLTVTGADGMRSQVRRHILGDRAPTPTYSGLCGIGGLISRSAIQLPQHMSLPAMIYTPRGFVMIIPTTADGQEVGWTVQRPIEERDRQGWLDFQRSGEASRITKEDYQYCQYQPIKSIMGSIVDSELRLWAPYEIPDLPTWHSERVCLLGDAAHAIPPTGGQGAAQAFEDAGFMARLLTSEAAVSKGYNLLFEHFEKRRKDRFQYVRSLTAKSGDTRKGSASGLSWIVKKWSFWAFFKLKGDLKDMRLLDYDVDLESIVVE